MWLSIEGSLFLLSPPGTGLRSTFAVGVERSSVWMRKVTPTRRRAWDQAKMRPMPPVPEVLQRSRKPLVASEALQDARSGGPTANL